MVLLRRLLLLMSVVGAGAATWTWWQRRDRPADDVPEWPAFPDPVPAPAPETAAETVPEPAFADATAAEPVRAWVAPVDGACPADHPVKLNENSGIFHVPGGRFYERTTPDRCYASADAAEADGYRAAKA